MARAEDLLTDHIDIRSPKTLYEVVESLKKIVSKGLLQEVPGTCSIADIQIGKPLPDDIINIEFKTIPGGTMYLLSCETYHGAGGVFKKKTD